MKFYLNRQSKAKPTMTIFSALILLMLATGCATLTKSSIQPITVNTNPPLAICTMVREGKTIGVVNPTPGTININKDGAAITVSCKKDGYLENTGVLTSGFEAMTLGNILFGGLIGVGIDIASGAVHQYDLLITITLIPEEFESISERDIFFNRMRADFLTEAAKVKNHIERHCGEDTCDSQLKAADAAKKARLAEIEKKRQLANVRN